MQSFSFLVNGKERTFEAANKLDAMGKANRHFGVLPQGAWMETLTPRQYEWNLGNFFD